MRTKVFLAAILCLSLPAVGQEVLKSGKLANVTRVTNDVTMKYENPRFSPDGNKIAFTGMGFQGMYVMDTNGAHKACISEAPGVGYMYQWGADSKTLLVRNTREVSGAGFPRTYSAWEIDLDGVAKRVSDESPEYRPGAYRYDAQGKASVVMGGKKLAVPVVNRAKAAGINGTAQISNAVKAVMNSAAYQTSFITDYDHLYAVDADGNKKVIFNGPAFDPVLSPNGKMVAFCDMADKINVCNIDGSNHRIVGSGFHPSWANNKQIVVQQTTDNGHEYETGELVLLNLNGAEVKLTSSRSRIEMNPCVSPDGSKLVFTDALDGQVYTADLK